MAAQPAEGSGDYDIADPRPEALVESLRAFGYTLPTAVADLVDNSISAGASRVWITAHWAGEDSWLGVIDHGAGMSEATLVKAMRAGSQNRLVTAGATVTADDEAWEMSQDAIEFAR
jgi:signal transduction histidine kinase